MKTLTHSSAFTLLPGALARRSAWSLIGLALAVLPGCDNYSTQDAYEQCELISDSTPLTDDAFAECVACYENCGSGCGGVADGGSLDFTCR